MYNGYDFYFKIGNDLLTLPITPGELTITNGSKNKVVTLISEGDVNILKSPSLTEIEFEARFPMRKYPFSRRVQNFEYYLNKFTKVKESKKPFRFSVIRGTPNGSKTWGTSMLVSLEELITKESADEGDDVIVSFKLKQYKEYGVKTIQTGLPTTTSTSDGARGNDGKGTESETYTVKPGDCLWNIAKAAYGDGSKWKAIYEANKSTIESTAEKHRGKGKGSQNGHWIYPGTKLVIPGVSDANLTVQKLNNNKSNKKTYKVKFIITGKSGKSGNVTLSYVSDGVRRNLNKQDVGTITVSVDSGTEVRVGIHPISAKSYIINGSSGIWSNSEYMYKITRIQLDSSLSINWI